jgi:hypothetical protein
LTIFEYFNEYYDLAYYTDIPMPMMDDLLPAKWFEELIRTPDPWVSAAMAWRSVRLEKSFASYVVDTDEFFKARKQGWIWES